MSDYKKKMQRKRIIAGVIALFMALIMILGVVMPFLAAAEDGIQPVQAAYEMRIDKEEA